MKYALFLAILLGNNFSMQAGKNSNIPDNKQNEKDSEEIFEIFKSTVELKNSDIIIAEKIQKYSKTIAHLKETAEQFFNKLKKEHTQLKKQQKQRVTDDIRKHCNNADIKIKIPDDAFYGLQNNFTKKLFIREIIVWVESIENNINKCKSTFSKEREKGTLRDYKITFKKISEMKNYNRFLPVIKMQLALVMSDDFLSQEK